MALLRGAKKLNQLFQSTNVKRQAFSLISRENPRHFSTDNAPSQPQQSSSPFDSFLRPSSSGVVYGRLMGVNENTLKTDVISLFEGCNLTLDDIKVEYNRMFFPLTMFVQFPSMSEFSAAIKEITRKGRLFRLEKTDRQQWDSTPPYNGSYVLFVGLPRNALIDDVECLLSGCNYDSSSLEIFTRASQPEPIRMAKARFPSPVEAMNAVIQKNGPFCLNNRIVTRIIQ